MTAVAKGALACLVVLVLLPSCGGNDDGDIETFCSLIDQGAGDLTGGLADSAPLDDLLAVSPKEIRPAVEQLRNLARDFNDIDPAALDQLFAAAFDADAKSARQSFDAFVADACGVDNATSGGAERVDPDQLARQLQDFVQANFRDDSWVGKVHYEVTAETDLPWAVRVVFDEAATPEEPATACRRVSVWLYEVERQPGAIEVIDDDLVAARAGPQGSCAER